MLVQVTRLHYWKSEHDEETCEDAYGENAVDGLFAVADGAGTTLFAQAWATFLVKHFLRVPLMSNDPFEVEWWVRLTQEQFKHEFPLHKDLAWNAQQKAQDQGSHSTLATLLVSMSGTTSAEANLLAFGDSCIIVNKPTAERLVLFPVQQPDDFEQPPICIPSKPGLFNRYFHQCHLLSIDLAASDVVVIASDAVSRWIMSAGAGRHNDQKSAFQEVSVQTAHSWPLFIQGCRVRKEMIDDDSTALVITLLSDASPDSMPLGSTTEHSEQVREKRKNDFMQALADNNKERVAIYFGDGRDLDLEGIQVSHEQIRQARRVADAQQDVLTVLRRVLNSPHVVAIMTPLWQKYADLLNDEFCAENLRRTLAGLGVPLTSIASSLPQEQVVDVPPPLDTGADMLDTRVFTIGVEDVLGFVHEERGEQ